MFYSGIISIAFYAPTEAGFKFKPGMLSLAEQFFFFCERRVNRFRWRGLFTNRSFIWGRFLFRLLVIMLRILFFLRGFDAHLISAFDPCIAKRNLRVSCIDAHEL